MFQTRHCLVSITWLKARGMNYEIDIELYSVFSREVVSIYFEERNFTDFIPTKILRRVAAAMIYIVIV